MLIDTSLVKNPLFFQWRVLSDAHSMTIYSTPLFQSHAIMAIYSYQRADLTGLDAGSG